jgi:copper homeostasis protein
MVHQPRLSLEVCVDDADGLEAAIGGGADRIELCSALSVGGLTPSAGLMTLAAEAPIPVVAMIRPRPGSFVWSEDELRIMEADIALARQAGLAGVVIGASLPDGRLNEPALQRLVVAAHGCEIVLHRCVDLAPDASEVVTIAMRLGIDRVLTSGGATTALAGIERIAEMHKLAGSSLTIMPGSGINLDTLPAIRAALPQLTDIHASCSSPVIVDDVLMRFGFAPKSAVKSDKEKVIALRAALDQI